MLKLLCIFIGGGLGSICRYSVGAYLIQSSQGRIPWATFAANALGCLLIGILIGYFERTHTNWLYMLLVIGFICFWSLAFVADLRPFPHFQTKAFN